MSKYKPGQVWSYKTRPKEESSRITILKVEPHANLGDIVHIRVSDVKMQSPAAPDGLAKVIHHSPFAEEAIDASVVELLAEDVELPDFAEGYDLWRESFDKGEAGVFTIPVAQSIEAMERVIDQAREHDSA